MKWFAVTHSYFLVNRCKMGYKSSVLKMDRQTCTFLRDLRDRLSGWEASIYLMAFILSFRLSPTTVWIPKKHIGELCNPSILCSSTDREE